MKSLELMRKVKNLNALKAEIEILTNHIDGLRNQMLSDKLLSDSVKGSQTEYPYVYRTINISGYDWGDEQTDELNRELGKTIRTLRQRRIQAVRTYRELMNIIGKATDPLIRQALILRYVEGHRWEEVADRIGGNNTGDSVRKMVERYLRT